MLLAWKNLHLKTSFIAQFQMEIFRLRNANREIVMTICTFLHSLAVIEPFFIYPSHFFLSSLLFFCSFKDKHHIVSTMMFMSLMSITKERLKSRLRLVDWLVIYLNTRFWLMCLELISEPKNQSFHVLQFHYIKVVSLKFLKTSSTNISPVIIH